MNKKISVKNIWLILALSFVFTLPYTNAFAWGRSREGRQHREVIVVGHERYHYRDGRFYRPGWFGFEFSVFAPPIGAIVRFLPAGHRTIVVAGNPYYYYDNVYYKTYPSGYIVVPAPVVNPNIMPVGQTVTVNVPNSNGSYTSVTLVKQGNGYIGPQGEYYAGNPSIDQLKALYGK